ncbi:hypothetical protein NDU88_006755 [Pleurodeles waltl]|uniref:Uncharacterized protein n=1 Tax=Pleurodeles waltl TaxID=8319 RepID=A0AAV7TXQ5_PLEWA|nr:hypothetical protein NDU88_006755 [Pleurodeles waltl]
MDPPLPREGGRATKMCGLANYRGELRAAEVEQGGEPGKGECCSGSPVERAGRLCEVLRWQQPAAGDLRLRHCSRAPGAGLGATATPAEDLRAEAS